MLCGIIHNSLNHTWQQNKARSTLELAPLIAGHSILWYRGHALRVETDFVQEAVRLANGCQFIEQPAPGDWVAAEADLGLVLPSDFKRLVSAFGSGVFGDDLYLFRLNHENMRTYCEGYAAFLKRLPRSLFPHQGGLLPIASTTSEIELCLDTARHPRESDIVIVDLGLGEVEDAQMGLSEFICRLYKSELRWADELRQVIWGDESSGFFTPLPSQ